MNDNVIDSLRIEIEGDSGKAVDSVGKLISTLEKIKNVTSGSNKGLNAIQKNLNKIAESAGKIDFGSVSKLQNLAEGLKKLKEIGNIKTGKTAERIVELGSAIDCLKGVDMSKLNEMANGLAALKNVGKITLPKTSGDTDAPSASTDSTPAYDGELCNAPSDIADTSERLNELNSNLTRTISLFKRFKDIATSAFKKVETVAASAFKKVATSATLLTTVAKSAFSKIAKKIKNLTKIIQKRIMYRALNAVISAITNGFKDGTNAVYQYSKALNGRLAKSLDTLATSLKYLKGSLGAMAAPLINMFTPAIESAIDKFVDLLNVINQVFARLSGSKTWTKAIKSPIEYAEAADAATAANKKLKKSLLGIDEINALTDNSSSSKNKADKFAGYEFTEVPLDNAYVDGMIDRLKDILWCVGAIGLGFKAWDLGKAIANMKELSDLKSLAFKGGLVLAVTGLTIIVKGMIDIISSGINWKNFAETLGGGGGIIAGGALIGTAFGKGILGAAVGAIIAGIPMYITGIWDAIKEGLNWLNGLLIATGATLAGAGIGFLIGGPVGAGIGALVGLAVGALTDLVILIVQKRDEIKAFFAPAWEWLYKTVLKPIGDFFKGVATWFYDNVIQPIIDFFTPIVETAVYMAKLIYSRAKGIVLGIVNAISLILKKVKEIFLKIVEIAIALGKAAYTYIIEPIVNFIVGLAKKIYDKVIAPVINLFVKLGQKAYEKIIKPIYDKLIWLRDKAVGFFQSVGTTVVNFISNAFSAVINGVLKKVEDSVNGFIKLLNGAIGIINTIPGVNITRIQLLSLPRLEYYAGGGTVNTGQMFIAREAGPELVGTIGNHTAVVNNDQIIAGISEGVADANSESNALLREQNSILRKLLEKETNSPSPPGVNGISGSFERKNRRGGRNIIPVGV